MTTASRSLVLLTQRYKPSLSLDFRSALPADVAFTRASAAYYTNSDGTLTSFASGAARVGDRGLLIEEARTNLLLRSQEFDNAAWSGTGVTVAANDTPAPDGTATADLIEATAATANRFQNVAITAGASVYLSLYVKYSNQPWISFGAFGSTGAHEVRCWFNVQSGALGTTSTIGSELAITSRAITAAGNGFYHIKIIVATTGTTSVSPITRFGNADGAISNTSGDKWWLWQADCQPGAFGTSPIATTSASVTRAVDVATITGIDSASWFNASEGALLFRGRTLAGAASGGAFMVSFDDGSLGNYIGWSATVNARFDVQLGGGAAEGSVTVGGSLDNTVKTLVGAYKVNDVSAAGDGVLGTPDTTVASLPSVSALYIGRHPFGAPLNGYIERIAYYPRRLPNAVLVGLTA